MIHHSNVFPRFPSAARVFTLGAGVCVAALLSACGGGGNSASTDSKVASGGSPATSAAAVTYSGPVTGLGSIVVNGVRFETIGASVHDADDPFGSGKYQSAIRLGTTVSVTGSADETTATGSAGQIRIVGGLRGSLTAINAALATLTVAGQTIKTTATTVYDGNIASFATLTINNFVEVYGFPQADGSFTATRIESYASVPAGISGVAVRGFVVSADAAAGVLTLSNGLTVSYAVASVSPAGALIVTGSDVRILASSAPVNGRLSAVKVLVLGTSTLASGSATAATGSTVKIKGFVESISGSVVSISGTKVDIGLLAVPAIGALVEVKGSLSATGVIQASRIELEDNGRRVDILGANGQVAYSSNYKQELYGVVANYASLASFTVQGVKVDASSARFEYGINSLVNNSYVEVKGSLLNGILVATKIELKGATASLSSGSTGSNDLSSGNSSFEIYATLSCVSYPANCSLTGSATLPANLTAAIWKEGGQYLSGSKMAVEAKGYLDAKGVFQVSKIEPKGQ